MEWIVGAEYKTRDGRVAILEFDGGHRGVFRKGQTLLFSVNGEIQFHYDDGKFALSKVDDGRDIVSRTTARPLTPDELADILTGQWIHDSCGQRFRVTSTRFDHVYLGGPHVGVDEVEKVSAEDLQADGWTFNGNPICVTE